MKRKIFGIVFALVLAIGLALVPAVPRAVNAATYSGYSFSTDASGTVVWSATAKRSGSYSVLLTAPAAADYARVAFDSGGAFSSFTAPSFWYKIEDTAVASTEDIGGTWPIYVKSGEAVTNGYLSPYVVVKITKVGSPDHFIVSQPWASSAKVDWSQWSNTQASTVYSEGLWHMEDFSVNPGIGGVPSGWGPLSYWTGTAYADYTVASIRVALGYFTGLTGKQTAFVDDITVSSTTYDLEPLALNAGFYKTGASVTVTASNANANTDPMAIETLTVSAISTTDTVGDTSVTLTETSHNSGIFSGTLSLIGAPPADRNLNQIVVSTGDTITVTYTGNWGAGSQTVTATAKVDDTRPTITIVSPAASSNITDATPVIQANYSDDTGSGVDNSTAVMKVDGTTVTPQTKTPSEIIYTPSSNLTDGSHTVTVDVSDAIGNAAIQKSWSFTIDTIAPVITGQTASPAIIGPVNTQVTFTANVADVTTGVKSVTIDLSGVSGSASVALKDDGVSPDTTAGDGIYTASANITHTTEANYNLTITAKDNVDNTKTATVPFGIWSDLVNPVISSPALAYPYGLSSARPGDTVTVSATVTDNILVASANVTSSAFASEVTLSRVGSTDVYSGNAIIAGSAAAGSYAVTITAKDGVGNTATDTSLSVMVNTTATGADISLSTGWNLVSLPLVPANTNVTTILAGISGNVTIVWGNYNAATGEWESYVPGSEENSLSLMRDGRGYWVQMANAQTLTVLGTVLPAPPAPPPVYPLSAGWNLIGFKRLTASAADAYLGTDVTAKFVRMYGFDAGAGTYTTVVPADNLNPGQGYWLAVSAAGNIYP